MTSWALWGRVSVTSARPLRNKTLHECELDGFSSHGCRGQQDSKGRLLAFPGAWIQVQLECGRHSH